MGYEKPEEKKLRVKHKEINKELLKETLNLYNGNNWIGAIYYFRGGTVHITLHDDKTIEDLTFFTDVEPTVEKEDKYMAYSWRK